MRVCMYRKVVFAISTALPVTRDMGWDNCNNITSHYSPTKQMTCCTQWRFQVVRGPGPTPQNRHSTGRNAKCKMQQDKRRRQRGKWNASQKEKAMPIKAKHKAKVRAEGHFTCQKSVRDFYCNNRISQKFLLKQQDFQLMCTRFLWSDLPLGQGKRQKTFLPLRTV